MRRARVDPWGPLVALVATGVFLLHGFQGALSRDVAVYAYAAQQVAEGVPPYVGILNRSGPLAHLVPGAGVALGRLVGAHDLIAMRVTMMVLAVLAVWAAYVLGRDLHRSRLTGLVAAATLVSFEGFVTYATTGPREKTTMVLLMLLALWAVSRQRWLVAGATTALAALTWQLSCLPVAAVVVVAVLALRGWRARVGALARFAGAGLAVAAAALLYFLAVGAVRELYAGFYLVNSGYAETTGILTLLRVDPGRLVAGYGWSLALLVTGIVGSFVVAGVRLRRLDRDSPAEATTVGLAVGTLVYLALGLRSFEGWPDAFPLLPFAACGVAGLWHLVTAWRPASAWLPRAGGILVSLLLAATAATAFLSRSTALVEQRRYATQVVTTLPGADLLAVNNPAPLVFARARNPIPYQTFAGGQTRYLQETYPGGLRGLARRIERLQPTIVTVFKHPPEWLLPVLERDYEPVGGLRVPWAWYASTDVTTREQRAELRQVIRRARPRAHPPDVQRSVP